MARAVSKVAPEWWDYTTLPTDLLEEVARLTPDDMIELSRDGFRVVMYDTLEDFYLEPEKIHRVLDMILDFKLQHIEEAARRFGDRVHGVFFSDDWGTQQSTYVSPETFREFFDDRYRQLVRGGGFDYEDRVRRAAVVVLRVGQVQLVAEPRCGPEDVLDQVHKHALFVRQTVTLCVHGSPALHRSYAGHMPAWPMGRRRWVPRRRGPGGAIHPAAPSP